MGQHQTYETAGELLRALAAPIRIAIVTELAGGQRCVHELVDALQVAQPLVSQHLRVLRGAGVVRGARRGREIAYSLVDDHVAHIVADAVSHAREVRHPGPGGPEPAAPAAAVPDAGVPDAGVPDAGVPDAGVPDAGVPDAGVPDGGRHEAKPVREAV